MMIRKCVGCLSKLGSRLFGESMARWQQHLDSYCRSNCQKYVWCDMMMDNFDIIRSFAPLSKQLEFEIKNTNISSEIVKIITRHYQEDENLFRFCIELFGSFLKLKFAEIINPSKATFAKLNKDYQQFLNLLKNLMVIYYNLEDREILGKDLFYKQTLPCLIVSFLFENQDVSKTVHHIIKQVYKQSIEQIQFNMQKYTAYNIEQFGISPNLCLNKRTLDMFQVGGNIMSERPYQGAIQIIKEIIRVTSPSEKLHLIQGLQKQIESTLLSFYKHFDIRVDGVEIDYKNMKAIMLYILVQANQSNLYSHLQIVNNFSPKKINKNNDCVLEIIISVLETLEKGHYTSSQLEESDFGIQNMQGKNYFDEVSSFQL